MSRGTPEDGWRIGANWRSIVGPDGICRIGCLYVSGGIDGGNFGAARAAPNSMWVPNGRGDDAWDAIHSEARAKGLLVRL